MDLSRYVGQKIIRIGPTQNGLYDFCEEPIIFKGYTLNGHQIRFEHCGENSSLYGKKEYTLRRIFSDDKWVLYSDWVNQTETRRLLLATATATA